MVAQVLKFPPRQHALPREPEDALPYQRRPLSNRLLPVLVIIWLFVDWALVTLGIIFMARGFR